MTTKFIIPLVLVFDYCDLSLSTTFFTICSNYKLKLNNLLLLPVQPQYSFQKILPMVHNSAKNVPMSSISSFSSLLREIEEQNSSSVSESNIIINENLVENEIKTLKIQKIILS